MTDHVARTEMRLAAWLTVAVIAAPVSLPTRANPVTHTVLIEATSYKPLSLAVQRGDIVVWINKDPFPHTVTASNGRFDSKTIGPGKSWTYTARKDGAVPYICTLHPNMAGTLRVGHIEASAKGKPAGGE